MPITMESNGYPSKSFHGDDSHSSTDPQPPKESISVIPLNTMHERDQEKYASIFKFVEQTLRRLDPPKAPKIDKDALNALGLLDFVHLSFPSPIALHRELLVKFISFFSYDHGRSIFHDEPSFINKDVFGDALKLPPKPLSRPPKNVTPQALTSAAIKFMEVYILPVRKRTSKYTIGVSNRIDLAMSDLKENMVYKVDWLSLIWEEALMEMYYTIHQRNETITWNCFYSAYWLRVIWVRNPKLFSADVILASPVHSAATNIPPGKKGYVVMEPETHQPCSSREQAGTSPQVCMAVDDVGRIGPIDIVKKEDGENRDVPKVSVGDVSGSSNLPQPSGVLRTRSATGPHAGDAREAMTTPSKCNESDTKIPEKNSSSKMHMEITYNGMLTSSSKRQIVDGPCGESITKKHRLITSKMTNPGPSSFEDMEVQNNLKEPLATSPEDEAVTGLEPPAICSENWDATESIKSISKIKQSVEEAVQQYAENVASVFESTTILSAPRKSDGTPGAPLQIPESACPSTKFVFQKIISDLKNLASLANAEQFNQQAFLGGVTMMLDGWDFFSPMFTEEIKQMVTKLKVLKKEIDEECGHQPQRTTEDLSVRIKQIDENLEKAKLVREQITKSGMEIVQIKLAGNKSQESLNALETEHINYIQEQERRIAAAKRNIEERKKDLRLVWSLKAKNADFFVKEVAANQAIDFCSTSFEEVTNKGSVLREELAKQRQMVEEDLVGPLQAVRSLITCYPIKE